ncbi:MAG TPA: hypothetical protein VEW92_09415 [Nitrososphaeraceae archaeon]|nr:hypothetical protein [Nitrososphaeraceae archaeon]
MKEISSIIAEMLEDSSGLIKESQEDYDQEKKWRETFDSRKNTASNDNIKMMMAKLSIVQGNDALLHSRMRRILRLSEMNMILTDALNTAIEKIEEKFPKEMDTIKTELSNKIHDKLGRIHSKFQKEKKFDEEVNKAAKEREQYIGDMFG